VTDIVIQDPDHDVVISEDRDVILRSVLIQGGVNTINNVGGGEAVLDSISGTTIIGRTIVQGNSITITGSATEITVATDAEKNSAVNIGGAGAGIFKQKTGVDLELRKVRGLGLVSSAEVGDEVQLTTTAEINTASNLAESGAFGLFDSKSGSDLQFKPIKAGSNIALVTDGNSIRIDGTLTFTDPYTPPTGTFSVVGDTQVQASGAFKWAGRAKLESPADSQLRVVDSTGTATQNVRFLLGAGASVPGFEVQFPSLNFLSTVNAGGVRGVWSLDAKKFVALDTTASAFTVVNDLGGMFMTKGYSFRQDGIRRQALIGVDGPLDYQLILAAQTHVGNTGTPTDFQHPSLSVPVFYVQAGGGGPAAAQYAAVYHETNDAYFESGAGLAYLKTTSGKLGFTGAEQTTVGIAGPASATPASPTKYIKVKDNSGNDLVIPAYNAA
jgi:hypothetical protein